MHETPCARRPQLPGEATAPGEGPSKQGRQNTFRSHVTELASGSGLVHRTAGSRGGKAGELSTVCLRLLPQKVTTAWQEWTGHPCSQPRQQGQGPGDAPSVQHTTRPAVRNPGLRNCGGAARALSSLPAVCLPSRQARAGHLHPTPADFANR